MGRIAALTAVIVFLIHSAVLAEDVVFEKVKLVVRKEGKSKEQDIRLEISDQALSVMDESGLFVFHEIPWTRVEGVVYERSQQPRWKTALKPWALFSNGKKHWLTVTWKSGGEGQYTIVMLDKANYKDVLAAIEAKTSLQVERVIE